MDVGLASAFAGGVLTLLSPCSVMLLPAFFSYAFSRPRVLIARTGVFYLGLVTTLVPLGVLAGTLGAFVARHRQAVVVVAAVIVVVLGALMLTGRGIPLLRSPGRAAADGTSTAAVFALGTVYGIAGVCAGPLLGAVLTLAGLGGNALYGGIVLLVFAGGMALPLLLLALLWGRLPFVRALVRPQELQLGRLRTTWTNVVSGLLTIAIGVLLLVTGGTADLGGILGATDQAALETAAARAGERVPDALVVAVVAILAAVGWLVGRLGGRRGRRILRDQRDQRGQTAAAGERS